MSEETEEITPFRRAFIEKFMPLVFELFQNMDLEKRYAEAEHETGVWFIGMWYEVYEQTCMFCLGEEEVK